MVKWALIFLFPLIVLAEELEIDPFSKIEHLRLENGLNVYLAPSDRATKTSVRLEVNVGWEVEKEGEWGVSHLLEHVLFRDKRLKDQMTYLQLIREAGGEANGSTTARTTSYFGSIHKKRGTWLLQKITNMIVEPDISEDYVEKEKGTVELEIGQPNPIAQFLGFNPLDYLLPKYLESKDFWESEFRIPSKRGFTPTEEQLSNRKLTVEQVKEHYHNYYYPSNMKLFITGNFNREDVSTILNQYWAQLPHRSGKKLSPPPKPNPRLAPYKRIVLTTETPYIYLGTKTWDVSVRDHEVLASYSEYLAHRLMKEIRNLKGQTYTAHGNAHSSLGYGYAYVGFQTHPDHVKENTTLAKKMIHEEAEQGQLTPNQVNEAIELYMGQYSRQGQEADDLMDLAQWYAGIVELFGGFQSPFEELKKITPEEYNSTLQKYYQPSHRYEFTYEPYFFFHYDIFLIYFLVAIGTFFVLRRVLTKKFEYNKIRWIRKVQFPPFKMLEGLYLLGGWFIFAHIQYGIDFVFKHNRLQSHVLIGEYLRSLVWAFCALVLAQGLISLLPRKLMIVNGKLIIKSATYFSRHIPLEDIDHIEQFRPFSFRFWKLLFFKNFQFRTYYYNPFFWKPGVAFHLKNGQVLYFSVRNASRVQSELREHLERPDDRVHFRAA